MIFVYFALAFVFVWSPLLVHGQVAASIANTPEVGECPPGFSLVRQTGVPPHQHLSTPERAYLQARQDKVLPGAWKSYLANVENTNIPVPHYVSKILNGLSDTTPKLAIAMSGGSYRAALFDAGVLNVLDGRNLTSARIGTGGLLQAATYLTSLSSSTWLLTSLLQADFPPIFDVIFGSNSSNGYSGWLTQFGILAPTNNSTQTEVYFAGLVAEITGKLKAGFPVTFADVWARTLARHFLNGTTAANFFDNSSLHGAGITLSGLANLSSFTSHSIPFPIFVADSISPAQNVSNIITAENDTVPLSNPLYEFNIFEMGSYDPMLSSFTPTKYLGTTNSTSCVTGYDQAAFVAATSSEVFNQFNISTAAIDSAGEIGPVIAFMNATIPQPGVELDVARYPNPFIGVAKDSFIDSAQTVLGFVDGGEDRQVIPLQPLLVKAREMDVILALDATGNSSEWADGSSMIATKNRTTLFPSAYSFPPIPLHTTTFIDSGLTTRPTFFGCDSATSAPLIIYMANGSPPRNTAGHSWTNSTSDQLEYRHTLQLVLNQVTAIAIQGKNSGSSKVDPEWPACLACAVVDRARSRSGVAREGVCASCFKRYCWSESGGKV